jgi:hypothetical protein
MDDEGKDYKCCSHCHGVHEWKNMDHFRGDGNCKRCEGSGKIDDSFRAQMHEFMVSAGSFGLLHDNPDYEIDCPRCNGTGQCQTCGGTGRAKRNRFDQTEIDDDDDDDYDNDDDDDDVDYYRTDDDEYSNYNNDKTEKLVISPGKSEEERQDEINIAFKNNLVTILTKYHSGLEIDAIFRNLKGEKLVELKLMSLKELEEESKYLGMIVALTLKYESKKLDYKVQSMMLGLHSKMSFLHSLMFPDEILNKSAMKELISQKSQVDFDYALLKKFEEFKSL